MWTVVNLVDRFCDRYDFFIVARNYDGREDPTPYTEVKTADWNTVGNARVYYLSDEMLGMRTIRRLIREVSPDAIFLNSYFATPSVILYFLRFLGIDRDIPLILAPCGNLSERSIGLKPLKKRSFIFVSRLLGLQKGVIWKATSKLEVKEIEDAMGKQATFLVAPDLPPLSILPDLSFEQKPRKEKGSVRLIFISRVVKKKNLDLLLTSLLPLTDGDITLDIVGPLEEKRYWEYCRSIIDQLPANIKVNVVGGVPYQEGLQYLVDSHFMVLPTLNENFGYVFIEAMSAGCPLLVSEGTTIWNDLEPTGTGWNLPLDEPEIWSDRIRSCCAMDADQFSAMSRKARERAAGWLSDPKIEEATASVLEFALNSRN